MKIGKRSPGQAMKALFEWRHYIALFNMFRVYPDFWDSFKRYFTGSGTYPYNIKIRTPFGIILPKIYSYHDMLTVNEVFCREDYRTRNKCKVIVDIGSNIGISALYFLTRNKDCRCYLFEPVPENVEKLKENLKLFEGRYCLQQKAVADKSGELSFGIEATGRYGGLNQETGKSIMVQCLNINDVLTEILNKELRIDLLKIDTEGSEISIMKTITPNFLDKIKHIYFEFHSKNKNYLVDLLSAHYYLKKYKGVYILSSHSSKID